MRDRNRPRSNVNRPVRIVPPVDEKDRSRHPKGRVCSCFQRPATNGDYCAICFKALGEKIRADLADELAEERRCRS